MLAKNTLRVPPCLSRIFLHIVVVTLGHAVATIALDITVAFDIILASVVSLVAVLTSSSVLRREGYLWNCSLLQRVSFTVLSPVDQSFVWFCYVNGDVCLL
jgi:hypothetical protein